MSYQYWFGVRVESSRLKFLPYHVMRILACIYFAVRNAKIQGDGIPKKGPVLLAAAPHTYWADPIILDWVIERLSLRTMRIIAAADLLEMIKPVARSVLIRKLVIRSIIGAFDPILVHRKTGDINFREELDKAVLGGCLVGLFVEESDKYNDLSKIRSGAASIAMKYPNLNICPVGIFHANPALGFRSLKIRIGKSFTVNQLRSINPKITKQEITQHLADNLVELI